MIGDWLATFEALKEVYSQDAYSNIAINDAIAHHKECSSGFVRMFAKGVIRDTYKLDFYIEKLAKNGLKGIKTRTLIIIRMGVYAIKDLDSVPDHAAVNEAVALAKKVSRGTEGFVNAILRNYLRNKDAFDKLELSLSQKYSFPQEVIDLIESQYKDETESILEGLSEPPTLNIRANLLKTTEDELLSRLDSQGINCERVEGSDRAISVLGGDLIKTDEYREGFFSVQSLSSLKSIEAFAPKSGDSVLDMCAAPGGKTCAIAELMGDSGKILACDIYPHRVSLIEASASRLGIKSISTRELDGTKHNKDLEDKFDCVLADVPCSGLGVIASKPELKLRTKVSEYKDLTKIQMSILENAFAYTKVGGKLMYSTCTINKHENDEVVQSFLDNYRCASLVEKCTILPYNNKVGFYYCIIKKSAK